MIKSRLLESCFDRINCNVLSAAALDAFMSPVPIDIVPFQRRMNALIRLDLRDCIYPPFRAPGPI